MNVNHEITSPVKNCDVIILLLACGNRVINSICIKDARESVCMLERVIIVYSCEIVNSCKFIALF